MNDLFDTPATDPTDAVTLAHYAERACLAYTQLSPENTIGSKKHSWLPPGGKPNEARSSL